MYSQRPKRLGVLDTRFPQSLITSDEHWAYREALYRFRRRKQVFGVSFGPKMVDEKPQAEVCVRVHVKEKLPESEVRKRSLIPRNIEGVPLDVVERVYQAQSCSDEEEGWVGRRLDPIQSGILVGGAVNGESGTLGMIALEQDSGRPVMLSAAHVLAGPQASTGDPILQPAGGDPATDTVGLLAEKRILGIKGDAAYAILNTGRTINLQAQGQVGLIQGVRLPQLQGRVHKFGYRTCQTTGIVDSHYSLITLDKEAGIEIPGFEIRREDPGKTISEKGDSGSVWFDDEGYAVGLHVAGVDGDTGREAFACYMPDVFNHLGLEYSLPLELPDGYRVTDSPPQIASVDE